MDTCIFCKIIKGELPSEKIYEDDKVLAILDIRPVSPGHTLVMPKEHVSALTDADDSIMGELMPVVKKVAGGVMTGTNSEGFNVNINNGRAAGQIVDHLHIHIIPRRTGDGLKLWSQHDYGEGEMKEVANNIRSKL